MNNDRNKNDLRKELSRKIVKKKIIFFFLFDPFLMCS